MMGGGISVMRLGSILMVTVPSDPDDDTISDLQVRILSSMEGSTALGLILDISTVQTVDSFFARTITETVQMVALMGGITVLSGMQAAVAVTTTQLGLTLGSIPTALNVDRAMITLQHLLEERRLS